MHKIYELMGLNCGERCSTMTFGPLMYVQSDFCIIRRSNSEGGMGVDLPARRDNKKKMIVPGKSVCHLVANPWNMYCEHGKMKPSWYECLDIWLIALPPCPFWNLDWESQQLLYCHTGTVPSCHCLPQIAAATMTGVSSLIVMWQPSFASTHFNWNLSIKTPQSHVTEASEVTVTWGCKRLTVAIMETPLQPPQTGTTIRCPTSRPH